MPRDSSGNYTLPAGNPVVTGTTISSSWGNNTLSDIASVLTASLDRSGNGGMLTAFKLVDGTAGAPGLTFTSDPDTGLYHIAANTFGVALGGTLMASFTPTGLVLASSIGLTVPGTSSFTGLATFTGGIVSAPTGVVVAGSFTGAAGAYTIGATGSSTAGSSYGMAISAGTNSSDAALLVQNQSGSAHFLRLFGDGHGDLAGSYLSWNATGGFTFSAPTGAYPALLVSGAANQWTGEFTASSTSGQSYGLVVSGGTTSGDYSLLARTQSGTALLIIHGDGSGSISSVSAGAIFSWSAAGNFTISPANSGTTFAVTGVSGSYSTAIYGATSGTSYGLSVHGGLTSSDYCATFLNAAGSTAYMYIYGDGSVTIGNPTGGANGIGTLNATNLYINNDPVTHANQFTGTQAASGSCKLPNGTKMCWGLIGNVATSGTAVPFADSGFASACTSVVMSFYNTGGGYPISYVSGATKNGFTAYASTGGYQAFYLAFGY